MRCAVDVHKRAVASGHRFDPACQCGFWAYDEAGFKAHGTVVGVIEGYGKTTVGTKGFRCEKARIVALSCENGEGVRHSQSVLMRLMTLYPEVALFDNLAALIDAHPETLRAWLRDLGRREAVAASLFVHPQTVRYRMGQLRER